MEPEPSELMLKFGATDMCHLNISKRELCLFSAKDGRLLIAWPFTCLRRYRSKHGKFTVEAGRRAPTGQGEFTFHTPQHDEIYRRLDGVIKARAGHTTSTPPPHKHQTAPINTGSTRHNGAENGYDHLGSHTPGRDNNPMKTGTPNDAQYASAYGHLQVRDKMTGTSTSTASSSVNTRADDQYNSLSYGPDNQMLHQLGVGGNVYSALDQTMKAPQVEENAYSILEHGNCTRPPPYVRSHHVNDTEDVYNVIGEPSKPTGAAGDLELSNREEDMYNNLGSTLQTNAKPLPLLEQDSAYDSLDQSIRGSIPTTLSGDNVYSSLDHGSPVEPCQLLGHRSVTAGTCHSITQPLSSPKRKPNITSKPSKPFTRSKSTDPVNNLQSSNQQQSSVDEAGDIYDTLQKPSVGQVQRSSEQSHEPFDPVMTSENDDDMYDKLEATKGSSLISAPVRRERSSVKSADTVKTSPIKPAPYKKGAKSATKPSTQSGCHSVDVPSSQFETLHKSVSLSVDNLDSYVSIDHLSTVPSKGTRKQLLVPAQRKTSAPDIFSTGAESSGKNAQEGVGCGIVSNLKGSLEAGTLQLTQPKQKPRKIPR